MRSCTSTSDGFSLLEVLVALCLSVLLLVGIAPLWITAVRTDSAAHGLLADLQRWRVVSARLEADLRAASAQGLPGVSCSPLLEASAERVVFVTRSGRDRSLEIVAWHFAGGSLMRRRAPAGAGSTPRVPVAFSDNKTMMERVVGGRFAYVTGGVELGSIPPAGDVRRIDRVRAHCALSGGWPNAPCAVRAEGSLGR